MRHLSTTTTRVAHYGSGFNQCFETQLTISLLDEDLPTTGQLTHDDQSTNEWLFYPSPKILIVTTSNFSQ
jgi:hypothetical protein